MGVSRHYLYAPKYYDHLPVSLLSGYKPPEVRVLVNLEVVYFLGAELF